MKSIPIYDATTPIVCTVDTDEIAGRVAQLERMREALDGLERTPDGLLLRFPNRSDIEADLRRFVVDEKRCCQFWGFDISTTAGQLTLRWDGPPTAENLMDRLQSYLEGDQPLTETSALL